MKIKRILFIRTGLFAQQSREVFSEFNAWRHFCIEQFGLGDNKYTLK